MYRYKTVVTDYEGMQEALSNYGAQDWKLISVTPDTWRIVTTKLSAEEALGIVAKETGKTREISASYYLLVFQADDNMERVATLETTAEVLDYPEFSLPEY